MLGCRRMLTTTIKKLFLPLVLGAAALLPASAAWENVAPGSLIYNAHMLTPGDNAPEFKKKANDLYGTQWFVDLYYGYWAIDNTTPGYSTHGQIAILYAILQQRLIEDSLNGGTWLRADLAGSWGLDHDTSHAETYFADGIGMCSGLHTDVMGPNDIAFLEVSVKHFFARKRACLTAGMIKLNNYYDRVRHARFMNDNFESSGVLPLPYNNLAAILQTEIDKSNYLSAAITRMGTPWGHNPFTPKRANGYALVGEYGHVFADGNATARISPFFCEQDTPGTDGRDHGHHALGLFGSIDYQITDHLRIYSRLGWAESDYQRCRGEFSIGTTAHLCPARPDDYLGVGFGIYKGADTDTRPTVNDYEKVLEIMYNVQVNNYFHITPYFQLILTPAYRDIRHASATGIQAGFEF